jgi:hypothetical protein
MNKEIIKKLIKIEKLKYEIIKDILPEKALLRLNKFEKEAASVIKDIAFELLQESAQEESKDTKKETKKVKIDFL